MTNISFERATVADAEELVNVQVAAFHSDTDLYSGVELGGPPGYDSVEHTRTSIQTDDFYKIVDADRIIGGMVIHDMSNGHYHLGLLFIAPAYHNRGIGTRALQFIEATYPATRWTLDTPIWAVRNHHFYEKCGYVKVGTEELPDITLIKYEKFRST